MTALLSGLPPESQCIWKMSFGPVSPNNTLPVKTHELPVEEL